MNARPPFRIQQHGEDRRRRVVLSGELNASTVPELETLLRRLCVDAGQGEIELDLSEVRFIDPAGLGALLNAKALCAEHLAELVVVAGARPLREEHSPPAGAGSATRAPGRPKWTNSGRQPWHRLVPRR